MEPRVIVTLNAENLFEAKAALDLLEDKLKSYGPNEPIQERVEVTNEGTI